MDENQQEWRWRDPDAPAGGTDRPWQWRAPPEEHLPPWRRPIVPQPEGLGWRGWLALVGCGLGLVSTVMFWLVLHNFGEGLSSLVVTIVAARAVAKAANR